MSTQHEEMLKRFDEKYPSQKGVSGGIYITMYDTNEMKDFIESEIDLAVANKEKEIVELIKSNSKGSFTDDGGNDCWYIDDLISLITNKSDINK